MKPRKTKISQIHTEVVQDYLYRTPRARKAFNESESTDHLYRNPPKITFSRHDSSIIAINH